MSYLIREQAEVDHYGLYWLQARGRQWQETWPEVLSHIPHSLPQKLGMQSTSAHLVLVPVVCTVLKLFKQFLIFLLVKIKIQY